MKFYPLCCVNDDVTFSLNRWDGSLRKTRTHSFLRTGKLFSSNCSVKKAVALCHNPFLIKSLPISNGAQNTSFSKKDHETAGRVASIMRCLCSVNFFLARLYASLPQPLFESAGEAISFFRSHFHEDQDSLCLPRALFAAKTSRRFQRDGVVLVGAFLPARDMHAWVIEGGSQADQEDCSWTNYQPVAALA